MYFLSLKPLNLYHNNFIMLENKYIIVIAVILAVSVFSYLVYKLIKSNETIKDKEEEACNLQRAIENRDFTIKKLKSSIEKNKENMDDDNDYITGKDCIEVFDNKCSEINFKRPKKKDNVRVVDQILPTIGYSETPRIDTASKVVADGIVDYIKSNSSQVLYLSDDNAISGSKSQTIESEDMQHVIETIKHNEDIDETSNTESMIDEALNNIEMDNIVPGDREALSDTMYVVKDDENSDDDESDNLKIEEIMEDKSDEEDGEDDYDYYDEEGNLIENLDEDVEYEEEDGTVALVKRTEELSKMSYAEIKTIAKSHKIKLTQGRKNLHKQALIENILEKEKLE